MFNLLKEIFGFLWKVIKALKKPLLVLLGIFLAILIGYMVFTGKRI